MAPYHIFKNVSLGGGCEGMDKSIQLNASCFLQTGSWAGQIPNLALDIDINIEI